MRALPRAVVSARTFPSADYQTQVNKKTSNGMVASCQLVFHTTNPPKIPLPITHSSSIPITTVLSSPSYEAQRVRTSGQKAIPAANGPTRRRMHTYRNVNTPPATMTQLSTHALTTLVNASLPLPLHDHPKHATTRTTPHGVLLRQRTCTGVIVALRHTLRSSLAPDAPSR
jgi:hypothetical protein